MPSQAGRGDAALCVILDLHSAQSNHQNEDVIQVSEYLLIGILFVSHFLLVFKLISSTAGAD